VLRRLRRRPLRQRSDGVPVPSWRAARSRKRLRNRPTGTLCPIADAGPALADVGTLDCHNNHNDHLLRYIVATLAYPDEVKTLDARFRDQALAHYTRPFNIVLSNLFERHVQRELLPLGIAPLAFTCRQRQQAAAFDAVARHRQAQRVGWTHACGAGKSIARSVSGLKPEVDFAFAGV